MKVLFTFGGMPHYLVSLLNKLTIKYNIDIVVVRPLNSGKTIGKAVNQSDTGANFKTVFANEYNAFFNKPYFKDFYQIINSEKPDIIVLSWPYILNYSFHIKTLLFVRKHHIKIVLKEIPFQIAPGNKPFSFYKKNPLLDEDGNNITPTGLKFYPWALMLWFTRNWYYRKTDASITYTDLAFDIEQSYGMKKQDIFVTGNSVDTDELFIIKESLLSLPRSTPNNPYRLIHIGRLVKWKRVDLIIQILPALKKQFPKTELVIIGEGPEKEPLKKMVNSLNINDSVKFEGSIYGYEKLGDFLLSSGVYVLAGMGGLSINEAMAFGKPVICSVCDGTERELVKNNMNGLIFEEGNADDLLKKIICLFENPELIEKMGKNSENIIKNKININTVAFSINEAFKYVIKNR